MVNLIPHDRELLPAKYIFATQEEASARMQECVNDLRLGGSRKLLKELTKGFPVSLQVYIYEKFNRSWPIVYHSSGRKLSSKEMIELYGIDANAYEAFVQARKSLQAIARSSWAEAPQSDDILNLALPLFEVTTYLTVDRDGQICFENDFFLDIVVGTEAARIRECQRCKKIFWAGRKDKRGCSTKCCSVISTRRNRETWNENKQRYEAARAKKEWQAKQESQTGLKQKGR